MSTGKTAGRSSRNRTRLAVLGVLSVAPMTGYEIRSHIQTVLGHFWHESFGQIYPTIHELEAEGLVEVLPSDDRRRRVLGLTDAGRAALREHLADPGPPTPPRNTLLLQLFFGRQMGPAWCRERVAEARAAAVRALASYDALVDEIAAEDEYRDERPYWLATVEYGRRIAAATIAWADAVVDTFEPGGA
jgi:DNA-binding PadR family transcriptional regulator